MNADQTLGVLIIGAHPDDPDGSCGGTAALYARLGHRVRLLTLTNGCAGHHTMTGTPLATRRRAETEAAGNVLGVDYVVLDNRDGTLEPTVAMRNQAITTLREFRPDIVIATPPVRLPPRPSVHRNPGPSCHHNGDAEQRREPVARARSAARAPLQE